MFGPGFAPVSSVASLLTGLDWFTAAGELSNEAPQPIEELLEGIPGNRFLEMLLELGLKPQSVYHLEGIRRSGDQWDLDHAEGRGSAKVTVFHDAFGEPGPLAGRDTEAARPQGRESSPESISQRPAPKGTAQFSAPHLTPTDETFPFLELRAGRQAALSLAGSADRIEDVPEAEKMEHDLPISEMPPSEVSDAARKHPHAGREPARPVLESPAVFDARPGEAPFHRRPSSTLPGSKHSPPEAKPAHPLMRGPETGEDSAASLDSVRQGTGWEPPAGSETGKETAPPVGNMSAAGAGRAFRLFGPQPQQAEPAEEGPIPRLLSDDASTHPDRPDIRDSASPSGQRLETLEGPQRISEKIRRLLPEPASPGPPRSPAERPLPGRNAISEVPFLQRGDGVPPTRRGISAEFESHRLPSKPPEHSGLRGDGLRGGHALRSLEARQSEGPFPSGAEAKDLPGQRRDVIRQGETEQRIEDRPGDAGRQSNEPKAPLRLPISPRSFPAGGPDQRVESTRPHESSGQKLKVSSPTNRSPADAPNDTRQQRAAEPWARPAEVQTLRPSAPLRHAQVLVSKAPVLPQTPFDAHSAAVNRTDVDSQLNAWKVLKTSDSAAEPTRLRQAENPEETSRAQTIATRSDVARPAGASKRFHSNDATVRVWDEELFGRGDAKPGQRPEVRRLQGETPPAAPPRSLQEVDEPARLHPVRNPQPARSSNPHLLRRLPAQPDGGQTPISANRAESLAHGSAPPRIEGRDDTRPGGETNDNDPGSGSRMGAEPGRGESQPRAEVSFARDVFGDRDAAGVEASVKPSTSPNTSSAPDSPLPRFEPLRHIAPDRPAFAEADSLVEQVVDRARLSQRGSATRFEVDLKPDLLGRVRIETILVGESLTARILVEDREVEQLLRGQARILVEGLQEAGLKVDEVEFGRMGPDFEAGTERDASHERREDQQRPPDSRPRERSRGQHTSRDDTAEQDRPLDEEEHEAGRIHYFA